MRKIVLGLIKTYQKTLSLDHGPLAILFPSGFCRFQPTCSEYTYQAIEKYGLLEGGLIGFWRINRCHPFNKGGFDPLPGLKEKEKLVRRGLFLAFIYILIILLLFLLIKTARQ